MLFKACIHKVNPVQRHEKDVEVCDNEDLPRIITVEDNDLILVNTKTMVKPSLILDLDDTLIHACFHPFKYSEAVVLLPITKRTQ